MVRAALGRQWRFANLPLGGGGLRAEAATLNNPAAGCKPTAGKAPSYGLPIEFDLVLSLDNKNSSIAGASNLCVSGTGIVVMYLHSFDFCDFGIQLESNFLFNLLPMQLPKDALPI